MAAFTSAPISMAAVLPALVPFTSTGSFQNTTLPSQSGTFTVEYDATPNAANIDGATALSLGAATAYSNLACIVRFFTDGEIDVRNGGSYMADSLVTYSASTSYHFRLVIDVSNSLYDVYVTPSGQSEVQLADDYDFRTDQIGVASLDNWTVRADVGTHTVSNLVIK